MIKVVHLITGLGVGGAEKQLFQLATLSNSTQFKHHVISLQDLKTMGPLLIEKNIPVYPLNIKRGTLSFIGLVKLCILLIKIRPAILQTWLYHADLLGLLVGKLLRVPKIIWNVRCSNMDLKHYSKLTAYVIKLCRFLSSSPDAIVVNSISGKELHERMGYQAKHWEWIPNGFQTNVYKPNEVIRKKIREELQLNEENFLIGMIARWDPMKDPFSFLAAAKELRKTFPQVRFLLAGLGMIDSNTVLVDELTRLGLKEAFYLMGPRNDIPNVLNALDMLVLTSAFGEGFPNVLGEAMATEVLCLATDVGDSARILDGIGKTVEHSNVKQLCDALVEMLTLEYSKKNGIKKIGTTKNCSFL